MRSLGPRSEVAVSLTILAVGAAVVVTMHLTWPEPRTPVVAYAMSNGGSGSADLKPFEINDVSGAPVDLRPGTNGSRTVKLSNPNGVDIIVMSLSAVPGQPVDTKHNRVSGCPAGVLTVTPMTTPVAIAASADVEVKMTVHVASDVPASCKDSVFPLTYSGRATHG
ncbi:MAG TPA: hypothetical protein VGP03_11290 [Pseudonocardiaceae bacterium]|jgi:hypothetical protein|nr:hypothetical protein [Pseudonocardiaceae bacterium]